MSERALAAILLDAARAQGDRIALRGEGVALGYRHWAATARALADRLRDAGLADDETVLVPVSNHPLDFAAFLGVWMAGGVVVPVHRTTPSDALASIQARARCRLCADPAAGEGDPVRACGPAAAPDDARRALLRDAALVIFTSGSTGLPKGVVLSHAAFAGKLAQNQRLLQMTPDDTTLLVLNNTFSFGIWMALLTLMHGGTVLARARFAPAPFLQDLAEQGVSRVGVVPTMIRASFGSIAAPELDAARGRIRGAGRLRDVVIGGEPLGADLSARLREFIAPAVLYDVYGLTETSTSDFVLTPQAYPGHPGSIGRPARGVAFRIAGEAGGECPSGMAGELQLKTPYIMAGYLDDEELTRAAFVDGWFRTGDLAMRGDDGFVTIVGRLKELIVRGANKIAPLEIERALCACPGVASAMVAGVPDPVLGQRIQALLVPTPGATLDAASVRAGLASRLERFKQPDACYVGSELPTGRTGKIDRGRLPALLAAGSVPALAGWAR